MCVYVYVYMYIHIYICVCAPAMTWSKIWPWKLGRKSRSADVLATQRRARKKRGSSGSASVMPRLKYWLVVRSPACRHDQIYVFVLSIYPSTIDLYTQLSIYV